MKEDEVLIEANRLVAAGLNDAAIDLLQESLDSHLSSPALLRALGRTYLVSKQPKQAAVYLKRSLEASQARKNAALPPTEEQDDDFSDEDLDFIDAQATEQHESDYTPFAPEPTGGTNGGAIDTPPPPRPTLHIARRNGRSDVEESGKDRIQIKYTSRRQVKQDDHNHSPAQTGGTQPPEQVPPPLATVERAEEDASMPPVTQETPKPEPTEEVPARPAPATTPATTPATVAIDPPTAPTPHEIAIPLPQRNPTPPEDQSAEQEEHEQDATPLFQVGPSEQNDQPPDQTLNGDLTEELDDELREELLIEEAEIDLDLDDSDDPEDDLGLEKSENTDDVDYLIESLGQNQEDDALDELAWDDYDDLDEFDELAQRESFAEPQREGTITRETRARQAATELLLKSDWPPSTLELLTQVFVENGWSAARVALEREIDKGLLPDELVLAQDIRNLWSENERFWTTYHRIKRNAPAMMAEAIYRHMSWAEALRIMRCFPAIPSIEEIFELIEETYEWWYAERRLRRSFPAFIKFLKYRTGSMRGTLPGHCFFSFTDWPENDSAADSIDQLRPVSSANHRLLEMGVQLPLVGSPPAKNIMNVNKDR